MVEYKCRLGLIVEPLQPETKCKIDAELYKLHKPQLEFIQCYRAFLIMGSLMSRIYDDITAEQWQNDKEWLQNLGEEIKDIMGNKVKAGDILLELGRGWGSLSGSDYKYHLTLWEMPETFDGHAYYYSIDGTKHIFAWAHVRNAIKVDMSLMPDGFEFSFKHGMSDISSKIEQGTLLELIENSNWKQHEVKKEEVERFEFMKSLKIEKIEDIYNNIEELKKGGYIPHEIVSKVLEITGAERVRVNNGEIGIAGMYDQMHYRAIIENISKNPNFFEK